MRWLAWPQRCLVSDHHPNRYPENSEYHHYPHHLWFQGHLKTLTAHLNLDGYFLVSPTALTYCLWVQGAPDDDVYNYSMRVKPDDLDLGSLARTDALVNELVAGKCSLLRATVHH